MDYVWLFIYLLVIIPDVLCDTSDGEFCRNDKMGNSLRGKRASLQPGMSDIFEHPPCDVPVCNLTGDERVTKLQCPNRPVPQSQQICAYMAQQPLVKDRPPFCCTMFFCENQTENDDRVIDGERHDYPGISLYQTYEEFGFYGNYEQWKGKSCKGLRFPLPSNCKLENDEQIITQHVGCNYTCEIPLTKTVVKYDVTRDNQCTFTHKNNEVSQERRTGYCENWNCRDNKLYLHMCINNTNDILLPEGCTLVGAGTGAYPQCCPHLECSTNYPWWYGFDIDQYLLTFQ